MEVVVWIREGQLPSHLHEGTLDLSHQLQEGGHHAERDRSRINTVHSPEESDGVSTGKGKLDHYAGCGGKPVTSHGFTVQFILNIPHLSFHPGPLLECLQQEQVLEAFLQERLHTAVSLPDGKGQAADISCPGACLKAGMPARP